MDPNVITTTSPNFSNQLEAAQANTLKAVQRQVSDWNNVLTQNFLTGFNNWAQSVIAGRADNTNPPQPPMGYEVGYFTDPTTGPGSVGPYGEMPIQWAYPRLGAKPVCEMPPIPGVPGANHNPSGVAMIGPMTWQDPDDGMQFFQIMPGDTIPVNPATAMSDPFPGKSVDGHKGMFVKVNRNLTRYYKIVSALVMLLVMFALIAPALHAQVTVKFTPESMAVPTAVVANAHDLGRWMIEGCNDGQAPVTIAAERLSILAGVGVRFVDWDDALLVLNSHVRKGFWAQVAHWGPIAAQLATAGLTYSKTISPQAGVAMSVGSNAIPVVTQIAQGEVPSVTPLVSPVKYPLTLAPGGCFTDHRFGSKAKGPQVILAVLK